MSASNFLFRPHIPPWIWSRARHSRWLLLACTFRSAMQDVATTAICNVLHTYNAATGEARHWSFQHVCPTRLAKYLGGAEQQGSKRIGHRREIFFALSIAVACKLQAPTYATKFCDGKVLKWQPRWRAECDMDRCPALPSGCLGCEGGLGICSRRSEGLDLKRMPLHRHAHKNPAR